MQAEAGTTLTPETQPDQAHPPQHRRALFWVVLGIAAIWIVLDQVTKTWAEAGLTRGEPVDLVPGFLDLYLVHNPGAAFSLATNATVVLSVLAVGVAAYIVWSARRLGSVAWSIGLGLLLGGALGNLVDRLVRPPGVGQGHVVDFLRFTDFPVIDFPVFNVADIGITSAAVLIALLALLGIAPDGRRAERTGAGPGGERAGEPTGGADE
jgi:signal peptidase II